MKVENEIIDTLEAYLDNVPFIFISTSTGQVMLLNLNNNHIVAEFHGLTGDDVELQSHLEQVECVQDKLQLINQRELKYQIECYPLLAYTNNTLYVGGNNWIQVFEFVDDEPRGQESDSES